MGMESIYKDLTGIDIDQQKQIWDERGKGYWGEYCLLRTLYLTIHGKCKFLMNVQIPVGDGKTTEIDLLMIHESGICCFEAKHYQGIIYGDFEDEEWTQYLRTGPNSSFRSPIKQNEYHMDALRRMFPGTPISSFVVFTNDNVDLENVRGWQGSDMILCKLEDLEIYTDRINRMTENRLSQNEIETIFITLSSYSPLSRKTINKDEQIIPFVDYVNQLRSDLNTELEECRHIEKKRFHKKLLIILGIAALFCLFVLIAGSYSIVQETDKAKSVAAEAKQEVASAKQAQSAAEAARESAEQALAEFSKKFKQVEPLNGGDVQLEDSFLEVYDLKFEKSQDLKDAYLFSCKIKVNGSQYGVAVYQKTSIIVHYIDGSISEHILNDVIKITKGNYGGPFSYYRDTIIISDLPIYTSSSDNIAYIKLTNAAIVSQSSPSNDLLPGTEFVLYEKN